MPNTHPPPPESPDATSRTWHYESLGIVLACSVATLLLPSILSVLGALCLAGTLLLSSRRLVFANLAFGTAVAHCYQVVLFTVAARTLHAGCPLAFALPRLCGDFVAWYAEPQAPTESVKFVVPFGMLACTYANALMCFLAVVAHRQSAYVVYVLAPSATTWLLALQPLGLTSSIIMLCASARRVRGQQQRWQPRTAFDTRTAIAAAGFACAQCLWGLWGTDTCAPWLLPSLSLLACYQIAAPLCALDRL